jgi:phage/plasmid-associated DNA primase
MSVISNNTSPFMAVMSKRVVCIRETENDAVIQFGKMKGITGGDKIIAINSFNNPFDFTPQLKLFLVCSKMPNFPSDDSSTRRRSTRIPFLGKFVDPDKVTDKVIGKIVDDDEKKNIDN